MADMFFNAFGQRLGDGTIDLDGHVIKACLLTSAYAPTATHTQYSDISGSEVANGNGYATGGKALTGVTWTRTGGTSKLDADDVVWPAATLTARYAVLYDDTAPNKDLILLIDFLADKSPSNGDLSLIFNAAGIFTLGAV